MSKAYFERREAEQAYFSKCLDTIKGKIAGDVEHTSAFVKLGNLHELVDSVGSNMLHYSVEKRDSSITKWLIDYGLDIDAQNVYGDTPLMLAVDDHNEEIFHILMKADADIELVNILGRPVLQSISYHLIYENSSIPGALLTKFLDECEKREAAVKLFRAKVPLNVAVLTKNSEILKYYLKRGEKVNPAVEERRYGFTALHVAVEYHDLQSVNLLLKYGADANALDTPNCTPMAHLRGALHCKDRQVEILKALLDHGADVSALVSSFQYMQIYSVLRYCNKQAIGLLLKANGDLPAKDGLGNTPLHYLADNENPGVFELMKDLTFNVNARNNNGRTALEIAVSHGNASAVQFLLDRGADANGLNKHGEKILYSAVMLQDVRCVELLVQAGAEARIEIFNDVLTYDSFDSIQPILAHLAMLETTGTIINEEIGKKISSTVQFREAFTMYKQQLERFKKSVIRDAVTMFKLLTESEQKLLVYLRNQQLVLSWNSVNYGSTEDTYYYRRVQERIESGIQKVQLKVRAAVALCEIMQICYDSHPIVIDKIFSYVSEGDWQRLTQVRNVWGKQKR